MLSHSIKFACPSRMTISEQASIGIYLSHLTQHFQDTAVSLSLSPDGEQETTPLKTAYVLRVGIADLRRNRHSCCVVVHVSNGCSNYFFTAVLAGLRYLRMLTFDSTDPVETNFTPDNFLSVLGTITTYEQKFHTFLYLSFWYKRDSKVNT